MLTTCTESPPTELPNSSANEVFKKEVLLKGHISIVNYAYSVIFIDKKEGIDPKRLECGYYYVDGREFDHFEVMSGKAIGIWPRNERYNDINRLSELSDKWCFTYYFHANGSDYSRFTMAMQAGFTSDKTMIGMVPNNYIDKIDLYSQNNNNIYGFYVDEPLVWGYTVSDFSQVRSYINAITPQSYFITGDYKPTFCFDLYAYFTDYVYYSGYSLCEYTGLGNDKTFGCPVLHLSDDQRNGWTKMKNRYGVKLNSNWISGNSDSYNEFIDLFGHARNLYLNLIWYYQLKDNTDDYNDEHIWQFCSSAWYRGFLRRFSHKVKYEYKCYNETTPCDCPPMNIDPDSWYLNKVIHYYGTLREDIPSE